MAGPPGVPNWSRLLTGLFGSFQTGAAQGKDTTEIWTDLRNNAGAWSLGVQGAPQPYDPAVQLQAGVDVLSAQGVSGANVSTFRGIAGQWLSAKTRLQGLASDQQITSAHVFTPPWAITADSNVPSRYRIKSLWQLENAAGVTTSVWRADSLTGPLTTVPDALSQVGQFDPDKDKYKGLLGGAAPVMTDFELEQI